MNRTIGAITGGAVMTFIFWWSGVDLLQRNPANVHIGLVIICGVLAGTAIASFMEEKK